MGEWQGRVGFIFSIADTLRGPFKPNQYGRVVLPFTVLRRLDCVLAATKDAVLAAAADLGDASDRVRRAEFRKITGLDFYNTSRFDFARLAGDSAGIAENLRHYVHGFSANVRTIFDDFGLDAQIDRLAESDRLFLVVKAFAEIDLHPQRVPNDEMGLVFEELVRKYNEDANETAGDHFTPREVIRLMVSLLFAPDDEVLSGTAAVRSVYDCCAGTGGMLAAAEDYLKEHNASTHAELFGQDYNAEAYAMCASDLLVKGRNIEHLVNADTLTADGFPDRRFDYLITNPPFGVEWKVQQSEVEKEAKRADGRFSAGTPRINDGSLLFLQHLISKMKPYDPDAPPNDRGGSRVAIVFNGSPLFTGDAGGSESNIRRWVIDNDWLEAVVALPDQLFYNTGIYTYVWLVTNRKPPHRRGKVQLIDGRPFFVKMRKSLGDKRHRLGEGDDAPDHVADLTRLYRSFTHDGTSGIDGKERVVSKVFPNEAFGYRKITVERPLRLRLAVTPDGLERLKESTPFRNLAKSKKRKDSAAKAAQEQAGRQTQAAILSLLDGLAGRVWTDRAEFLADLKSAATAVGIKLLKGQQTMIVKALGTSDPDAVICRDRHGNPEPDADLRDYEYVPLTEDVNDYFAREVAPYVPDAWIDEGKVDEQDGEVGVVGYEIPLNRHFYVYTPPRPLEDIEADIRTLEQQIVAQLGSVLR